MKRELFSLQDKVALIAGGAGDIGAACARAYAHYGARIIIFDRDPGKIRERLDEWKKRGDSGGQLLWRHHRRRVSGIHGKGDCRNLWSDRYCTE